MAEWWNAFTLLQQIFLCAAVPFTLVLIVQVILTFIGLGGHEGDADGDGGGFDAHDVDHDFDAHGMDVHDAGGHETDQADGHADEAVGGFRFFTIRGIVAFFCIFGWAGFALCDTPLSAAAIIPISFVAGLAAMLLIGLMFFAVKRMQDSGNIRYSNAIGQGAQVYIPIPAKRTGAGKVMVTIQERLVEAEAVTDETKKLATGETVQVVGNIGNTLIVKR